MKRLHAFLISLLIIFTVCTPVFANGSIEFNISDGDTLAGAVRLLASGGDALSFAVDGQAVKASVGFARFSFACEGMDYAGGKLFCGDMELSSLPSASGKHELELDQKKLTGNDVVLTYVPASSEFVYGGDRQLVGLRKRFHSIYRRWGIRTRMRDRNFHTKAPRKRSDGARGADDL